MTKEKLDKIKLEIMILEDELSKTEDELKIKDIKHTLANKQCVLNYYLEYGEIED